MDANAPNQALGRRVAAALADLVLCLALFVFLALTIGDSDTSGSNVSLNLNGGSALVFAAIVLGYFFFLESISGQTLGKALAGVRVVRVDGSRPSAGAVAARTVLRLIDGFLFYAVGLVVMLVSPRRQRLGDLAGKTTVVRA